MKKLLSLLLALVFVCATGAMQVGASKEITLDDYWAIHTFIFDEGRAFFSSRDASDDRYWPLNDMTVSIVSRRVMSMYNTLRILAGLELGYNWGIPGLPPWHYWGGSWKPEGVNLEHWKEFTPALKGYSWPKQIEGLLIEITLEDCNEKMRDGSFAAYIAEAVPQNEIIAQAYFGQFYGPKAVAFAQERYMQQEEMRLWQSEYPSFPSQAFRARADELFIERFGADKRTFLIDYAIIGNEPAGVAYLLGTAEGREIIDALWEILDTLKAEFSATNDVHVDGGGDSGDSDNEKDPGSSAVPWANWYETLPPLLQFLLRYLFFGWIWMK